MKANRQATRVWRTEALRQESSILRMMPMRGRTNNHHYDDDDDPCDSSKYLLCWPQFLSLLFKSKRQLLQLPEFSGWEWGWVRSFVGSGSHMAMGFPGEMETGGQLLGLHSVPHAMALPLVFRDHQGRTLLFWVEIWSMVSHVAPKSSPCSDHGVHWPYLFPRACAFKADSLLTHSQSG